jgi:MFS family permease
LGDAEISDTSSGEARESIDRPSYKWSVLAMLALSNVIAAADRSVVSVIAEPLKMDFHLSDKAIGVLGGIAFSATYSLVALPIGYLIDRVDRRTLLSVAISIWSVLTALCAMSGNFAALVAARMGVGAAEAPSYSTSLSLIADIFPRNQRNTAVSIYIGAGPLGAIVIFLTGAQVLLHFGWRMVFLVAGIPGLILAALFYLIAREPPRGGFDEDAERPTEAPDAPAQSSLIRSLYSVMSEPALRYAIAALTISVGVIYSLTLWNTSFLVRVHGLTVHQGAIWTALGFAACMSLGSVVAGPLADRFSKGDPRRATIVSVAALMIAVASGAVMAFGNTLVVTLVGVHMVGLMAGFFVPSGYAMILSLAPPSRRGTTMGAALFVMTFVGTGLIPLITGAISDAIGRQDSIRVAISLTSMLLLIGAACYMRIRSLLTDNR